MAVTPGGDPVTGDDVARDGAASIYAFVERSAEPVDGGVRWQTLDWHNRPHYHVSIWNGIAGIALFLADYFRVTGTQRALDLALGGARWCSAPERTFNPDEAWLEYGLVRGRSGVGAVWLRLAEVTDDAGLLEPAAAIGEALLRRDPGPVTDWQDGAPGEGVFLLRLGEATGDRRFLDGARARGAWLVDVAARDAHGVTWPWQVDHEEYAHWRGLSFVPGSAGIAHFLLSLYAATGDQRCAAVARDAAETLLHQAVPDRGGLNWPDTLDGLDRGEDLRCQWCYGASGVGLYFVKAYETLGAAGAPRALETAVAAGECTYAYGDVRRNPCQCHGLAGNGELFLELYRVTHDPLWLDRAAEFARRALAYRTASPAGDVWQSDDPGHHSLDFFFGAAGTGHFFLRLLRHGTLPRPLL